MLSPISLTHGTGSSQVVNHCQICKSKNLQSILFLGYLPPVNTMPKIGSRPEEQAAYPAELVICTNCNLAQLGLVVDPKILFPPEYPYSSGSTKILRDNFAELYKECVSFMSLGKNDLVVDIGSNDGTLLSNFKNGGHQVLGIEPTLMSEKAIERGIPTEQSFFNAETANRVLKSYKKAKLISAANVFAHIENVDEIVESIVNLLQDDGVFVSESHYLLSLVETLQYDTIYHEHLRYYSLTSLHYLLNKHGLEIIDAKRIPTHGGSIRVYCARKGHYPVRDSVRKLLALEKQTVVAESDSLKDFKQQVALSKLELLSLIFDIKRKDQKIFGVGAPSRASTLINHVGIDDNILDCVVEIKTSYKIGKYMPGTIIPVKDEQILFDQQPDYALLLSWHIADELIDNLSKKGFRGKYIVPLPKPHIREN